jgi:hypothetical protein
MEVDSSLSETRNYLSVQLETSLDNATSLFLYTASESLEMSSQEGIENVEQ